MSNQAEGIISDLETEYGQRLDVNNWPDVLCDGDTCRHSECECWNEFQFVAERSLKQQAQDTCRQASVLEVQK